jgi:mRNA-degrading endonuclease toxin of MazEF toxin-antitoxin module
VQRAEVWWAHRLHGQRHPVLLLSWDAHRRRDRVTIADITTNVRAIQTEVHLTPSDGMPRASVVNLDSLATVPRGDLIRHITTLRREKMDEVERALHIALGMPLPCRQE